MCGFIVTNKEGDLLKANKKIERRGPDGTRVVEREGIRLVHNLLSITGETTLQPVERNDLICLFNGEVYNHQRLGTFKSDVFAILAAYEGVRDASFVQYLDGEFAICLVDLNRSKIYFSSDVFGIKPLYYALDDDKFGFASYRSALESLEFSNIQRVEPNMVYALDLITLTIREEMAIVEWNLGQDVATYDLWCQAFEEACRKRFLHTTKEIILPMSSGMDSGAIACALQKMGASFRTFSFQGSEDISVISDRMSVNQVQAYFTKTPDKGPFEESERILAELTEPFFYGPDYQSRDHNGKADPGSKGLSYILFCIKQLHPETKILASGVGGDEIHCRNPAYKFGRANPTTFTDDLRSVFPWDNFYKGAASSYLGRDECISGAYGIEGRYPFFDKNVVQEYLNLKPSLKNRFEKAPLLHYLQSNEYPHTTAKRGFSI